MNTPTDEQIRARAYQIFVQRGCRAGHEMDDWLQAEYELLELPVAKLAKLAEAPPIPRGRPRKSAVVSLVRAAILLAGTGLAR